MLIQADAFHLPYVDNLFHACITSPPYWGLRTYSGEQGDEPLGLEKEFNRYIDRLVAVFREVHRVLRPDGVLWLNLGDCYTGGGRGGQSAEKRSNNWQPEYRRVNAKNYPQGSLMLIPHRVAIALQDDGWIVRNDLIWFKRNPMPENISGWHWHRHRLKDENDEWYDCPGCEKCLHTNSLFPPLYVLRKSSWRHTRAHEYIFPLVKKMGYYCNQEAVREGLAEATVERNLYPHRGSKNVKGDYKISRNREPGEFGSPSGRNPRSVLGGNTPALEAFHYWLMENYGFNLDEAIELFKHEATNPDSVLDVPTAPYRGAHYATFPPKLIAPLIRASVPRRCCPACGQAWAAVVEKTGRIRIREGSNISGATAIEAGLGKTLGPSSIFHTGEKDSISVTDYRPTCECGYEEHEPGIVLDIFGGSGTTGMVAKQLMRQWVVMDISRPYLDEQAKIRTKTGTPSKGTDGLPLFDGLEEGY